MWSSDPLRWAAGVLDQHLGQRLWHAVVVLMIRVWNSRKLQTVGWRTKNLYRDGTVYKPRGQHEPQPTEEGWRASVSQICWTSRLLFDCWFLVSGSDWSLLVLLLMESIDIGLHDGTTWRDFSEAEVSSLLSSEVITHRGYSVTLSCLCSFCMRRTKSSDQPVVQTRN